MKKEKRKRIKITEVIVYILQQVFLRTVGSWGAFVIDENGNFIDYEMMKCNYHRIYFFD